MAVRKVEGSIPEHLKKLAKTPPVQIVLNESLYEMSVLTNEDMEFAGGKIAKCVTKIAEQIMESARGLEGDSEVSLFDLINDSVVKAGVLRELTGVVLRGAEEEDIAKATLPQLLHCLTVFYDQSFKTLPEAARMTLTLVLNSFGSTLIGLLGGSETSSEEDQSPKSL